VARQSGWVIAAMGLVLALAGCSDGDDPVPRQGLRGSLVTSDVADRQEAWLNVVNGATAIVVRAVDLDAELFRGWTPDGSGVTPHATVDRDVVRLSLRGNGNAELHVELNAEVLWHLQLDGGASVQTLELKEGRLGSLDFGAGSSRIEAVLPRPNGLARVRMTGGASTFDVHLPAGVPARVLLAGGAGQASIDGAVHNGIAGGTELSTQDWTGDADGYDLNLVAGVSAFSLDRT
jgi:hypothetical protein